MPDVLIVDDEELMARWAGAGSKRTATAAPSRSTARARVS